MHPHGVNDTEAACEYPASGLVGWAVAMLVVLYMLVPRQKATKLRT